MHVAIERIIAYHKHIKQSIVARDLVCYVEVWNSLHYVFLVKRRLLIILLVAVMADHVGNSKRVFWIMNGHLKIPYLC